MSQASASDWEKVASFATATGASLVLGLNQLLRDWPDGGAHGCGTAADGTGCRWNPANAKAWIAHNRDHGHRVYGYELGNEPGCYLPKVNLTPAAAAHDYAVLKKTIADVYAGTSGAPLPLVLGPDVGGCSHAVEFNAILAGHPAVDIATFHHYVLPGSTARHGVYSTADFAAAAASNITQTVVQQFRAAADQQAHGTPVWLGEGATTYSNAHMITSLPFFKMCLKFKNKKV